jgi:hypothetical protein
MVVGPSLKNPEEGQAIPKSLMGWFDYPIIESLIQCNAMNLLFSSVLRSPPFGRLFDRYK